MSWPRRRSRLIEVQLRRDNNALQMMLVRVREQLQNKERYATGLELLLHERLERIDELTGKLEQSRQQTDLTMTGFKSGLA